MKTQQYHCPQEFLDTVGDYLMQDEVLANLPLGILHSLKKNPESAFLAVVTEDGRIQLVLVKTTSHLVIHGHGDRLKPAVSSAIDFLIDNDVPIPSIIGPRDVADLFTGAWRERTNISGQVEMEQWIYRLDIVKAAPRNPGYLRPAQQADLYMITQWVHDFAAEALEQITMEQAQRLAQSGIADQTIFLWQDGETVTMAKKTRPTENGVVINLVYTPLEHRKKGYATSCVAELSQELLDEGYKFCSLYTDVANPSSNKIYRSIGYEPVGESIVYRFDHPPVPFVEV